MKIFDNWKAPTPAFFKKMIRFSMTCAVAATTLLLADTLGKAIIPDFSFKLHPYALLICKNVVVLGLVSAAIAKFQKEEDTQNKQ